jgi:hypothetical protein
VKEVRLAELSRDFARLHVSALRDLPDLLQQ